MTTYHSRFSGRFTILVTSGSHDGPVVRKLEFDNLITNTGLDRIGSITGRTDAVTSAQVGSGSTPPAFTDTALAAHVATKTSDGRVVTNGWDSAGQFHWRRFSWQFAQGAAAGNLTEVGVGTTNSPGSLFSRALILDGNGSPTTLVILPNEFLTIVYEVRNYPPTGDVVVNTTIDGVARAITIRPSRRDAGQDSWREYFPAVAFLTDLSGQYSGHLVYSGSIGSENSLPAGTEIAHPDTPTWAAYVPGTYRREVTSNWSINQGNLPGGLINAIGMRTQIGEFQMGISPPIVKDNTKSLRLTTAISWGRYTP